MKNIAIVLGSFHKTEVGQMLDEARKTAAELGLTIVEEVWVPGSVEKPLALKRLLMKPGIDGAVALGIIEKGGTKHGNSVATRVHETDWHGHFGPRHRARSNPYAHSPLRPRSRRGHRKDARIKQRAHPGAAVPTGGSLPRGCASSTASSSPPW